MICCYPFCAHAPPASTMASGTDDHVPLNDHIPLESDHILPGASWDAHVEALFLACSQHFEEEEEEQTSKRIKLDTTPGSSSIK